MFLFPHVDFAWITASVALVSLSTRLLAAPGCYNNLGAANSLVESGISATEVVIEAKSTWGKRYSRTMVSPTVVAELEAFEKKYQKLSDDKVAKGNPPVFRSRKGVRPSSAESIRNVGKCGVRGWG